MDSVSDLFLDALKASLENRTVRWDLEIQPERWRALFAMAEEHHVLPMIYEAVYDCPAARCLGEDFFAPYKRRTIQAVTLQTRKTSEFLALYSHLRRSGVTVCVVKGLICRSLYPQPDARLSADEDIWIPPEQFRICHAAMLSFGMVPYQPEQDLDEAYEVPYRKPGSALYIELHKRLFPPDSEAYGELNRFFDGAMSRLTEVSVQGVSVATLEETDHLLYLLLHALKHFLHSGFGIRQVCDISLFANACGARIDWPRLLENLRLVRAELFAAAVFRIGKNYLTFDPSAAHCPAALADAEVDEMPMLEDLLSAGVYGSATRGRLHSAGITLGAVTAQKRGRKEGHLLKTLFPSAKSLEGRFPYLKQRPYLLPLAWTSRMIRYGSEAVSKENGAAGSLKLGSSRIALLKRYGILQ